MSDTNTVRFESVEEAREGFRDRGIREALIDELVAAVRNATRETIDEYDLDGRVNENKLETWIQIGYAEAICEFLDADIYDAERLTSLIAEIQEDPVRSTLPIIGRILFRSEEAQTVSRAISRRHNESD